MTLIGIDCLLHAKLDAKRRLQRMADARSKQGDPEVFMNDKPLAFPKTQLAIISYDKGMTARSKLWEKVRTKRTLREAMAAHNDAMRKVRDAFWEDTKEHHGLERSSFEMLNIETARFWAQWKARDV